MELFKLVGSIMVDSAEAQNSIQKTGEKAEGLGSKLSQGIKTAGKWAAGVVAGAAAVGTAMVAAAKDTASQLDVVDKASKRMGITAESYQELAHAAGLCGVQMSTMEKAAKKLEGTDLSMDDAINQLMSIEDVTERTQAAIDMFGESVAYEMGPLLQESAESFESMKDEAHELGLVMSDEAVADGAAMNDMFSNIEESVSALKSSLMAEFMPYIMQILSWVIENIPKIKDTVSKVLNTLMPIIEPVMQGIMSLIEGIFALINGDTEGFINGFVGFFENIIPTLLNVGKNILNALWDGFKAVWGKISDWVNEKVKWIVDLFKGATNDVQPSGNPDGSHASGLAYVPYDGYRATLHRGETVLTADEADDYRNGAKSAGTTVNLYAQTIDDATIDYIYSRINSKMGAFV